MLDGLPAGDPGLAEATWQRHCHAVLKSALDELPPLQRQALGLALVDDLTHEQVAAELGLPLGTAKTRIRAGLVKLRGKLGSEWARVCSPRPGSSRSVSGTPLVFLEEANPRAAGTPVAAACEPPLPP